LSGFLDFSLPSMPASSRHDILQALVWSVLAHALILVGILSVFPARLAPPPRAIKALLKTDARQPTAPAVAAPVAQAASAAALPQSLLEPKRAAPLPGVGRLPLRAPVSLASLPSPSVSAQGQTDVSTPAEHGREPARVQGSPLVDAITALPDAAAVDDLRQYRISLATAARRFKRYPDLARERGWEGVVEIELRLRARLPVPEVILVRSSGHSVLDQQAQDMIAEAARATRLPERLKGRDLQIMLPVSFSLDGAQ
jgi:protein TonB